MFVIRQLFLYKQATLSWHCWRYVCVVIAFFMALIVLPWSSWWRTARSRLWFDRSKVVTIANSNLTVYTEFPIYQCISNSVLWWKGWQWSLTRNRGSRCGPWNRPGYNLILSNRLVCICQNANNPCSTRVSHFSFTRPPSQWQRSLCLWDLSADVRGNDIRKCGAIKVHRGWLLHPSLEHTGK